ncbi:transcription termination factor Rho [Amycolatopsis australiensis]|uniref:Transcription termination factor Rho n=1 Tax=Amycolatopsis australiensis TaxID=546364 RepID=A0A1K1SSV4_9PSEU|nr:transcription termination factor Rho [Amycolatopsis australiensis]SFW87395.1 transcription termination factor Rho [Amycolatopsis australiensis]
MSFHGILDVSAKSAFVRTGYRPAPDDVVLPLSFVRKHKLRPGDEITGTTERLTSVNGADPAEPRPFFGDLVPVHPDRRLLLETTPTLLLPRVIDLATPLGKGQRALVVSPPKAGKTTVLRDIGHGISVNHPECRLMVLLADERPEEVTELRRTVRGEVIASTFDRPPAEHVAVAELAVERAKRLVERGEDVVLLLDSLTRLGRAYNLSARPSGRTLSGGVDAAALQPMKRILGAARNLEGGGSLTIVASALVETGSLADTVFFEELKSTGNAELKLDRRTAERRVFPAVDLPASGTRREELLVTPGELAAMRDVRRALAGPNAIEQLLDQLRKTGSNAEFLLRVTGAGLAQAA